MSKPIKLLIDMHYFDGAREGVTSYLAGLYRAMIKLDANINFYFCATDIDGLKDIFGEHSNIFYIKIPNTDYCRRMFMIYPELIDKLQIDFSHFQYSCPFRCKGKKIVTIHDIFFEDMKDGYPLKYRLPRHFLFRYAARHADLLLTVCDYSKQRIAAHYRVDGNRIIITPNAVSVTLADDVAKSHVDIPAKYGIGKYILYLSRKEPRKNHLALVEAYELSKLWEKGYDLALVGKPSVAIPELESCLKKLPRTIREHIFMIDGVDYPELCGWYKSASLFVYSSIAEGFGIPPLEAAVCKIPVICSNLTSMADFSFFGKNHIDPNHRNLLAERMIDVLKNPELQNINQIAKIITNRYSWENTAGHFYEQLKISVKGKVNG